MLITSEVAINLDTSKKQVVTVSKSSVMWTGKRSVVYVKTSIDEPIFEMREVRLGNELEEKISVRVLENTSPGESIFSLSAIIGDWLNAIKKGHHSTITILPPVQTISQIINELETALSAVLTAV